MRQMITYLLMQMSTSFQVDRDSGAIYVTSPLDYEVSPNYTLAVMASDRPTDGPALVTYAAVVVHVSDVNDNSPAIAINTLETTHHDDGGITWVPENVEGGSFVAHVVVTDRDSAVNAGVSCRLGNASATEFQLVQLGHNEFKVISTTMFDREQQDIYRISITCEVRVLHSGKLGAEGASGEINPLMGTGNYSTTLNNISWYTDR